MIPGLERLVSTEVLSHELVCCSEQEITREGGLAPAQIGLKDVEVRYSQAINE